MNMHALFKLFLLSTTAVLALSACTKISLSQHPGKQAPNAQPANLTNPGSTNAGQTVSTNAATPLEGYWQIGFQFGDKIGKSNVLLHQHGSQISGSGSDEDSGRSFSISGKIDGQDAQFVKKYDVTATSSEVPTVQYQGKLQTVHDADYQGPYLSGRYSTVINGQPVSDQWEAQLSNPSGEKGSKSDSNAPPANTPAPGGDSAAPTQEQAANKAPDLSGKWNVAYKFNFKVIKSTMFLEQDGGHLSGRGVDVNTNEKFEIEKGWYAFPKITIVRTYKKGKGGAATDRTVEFKGKVELVHDKDYQGPYLSGETQSGGEWEGQLVR